MEAGPAAMGLRPAGWAETPAVQSGSEMELVSEGEPETEATAWGERMAGGVRDEAAGAVPAGCAGQAGAECAAEAANGAARRLGWAGSEMHSEAAGAGGVMAVSAGAKQGLAGCGNEEEAARGPGAGWGPGMLVVKPVSELQKHSRLPAAVLAAGLGWGAWEEEPGRSCRVPAILGVVPAALAAERMNLSRSHCLEGWGCWVMCCGYPGRCPWGRCSLRR